MSPLEILQSHRATLVREAVRLTKDLKEATGQVHSCLIETNGFPVYSTHLQNLATTFLQVQAQVSAIDEVILEIDMEKRR